jgi:hypothetical protein
MRKFFGIVIMLVGILCFGGVVAAQSAETPSDLWIDFSLGPPLVELFNETGRPNDIARVENVSQFRMLGNITTGRKLVVFKSVAEAAQFLPEIADGIDIVGYNLENGLPNPAEEQADPVASVQRMRQLVDQYGLELMMGPDQQFALEYGVEMAPYVDLMVLQVQRVQTDPQTVSSYVVPMSQALRAANPNIEISMQIRTEGDVNQLVDLLDLLKNSLDGVSILTSIDTTATATELMYALREPIPVATGLTEADVAAITEERQEEATSAGINPQSGASSPSTEGSLPSAIEFEAAPALAAGDSADDVTSVAAADDASLSLLSNDGDSQWILIVVAVLVVAALIAAFMALRTDTPTRPKGRV